LTRRLVCLFTCGLCLDSAYSEGRASAVSPGPGGLDSARRAQARPALRGMMPGPGPGQPGYVQLGGTSALLSSRCSPWREKAAEEAAVTARATGSCRGRATGRGPPAPNSHPPSLSTVPVSHQKSSRGQRAGWPTSSMLRNGGGRSGGLLLPSRRRLLTVLFG
jgi:hypothetical protein